MCYCFLSHALSVLHNLVLLSSHRALRCSLRDFMLYFYERINDDDDDKPNALFPARNAYNRPITWRNTYSLLSLVCSFCSSLCSHHCYRTFRIHQYTGGTGICTSHVLRSPLPQFNAFLLRESKKNRVSTSYSCR